MAELFRLIEDRRDDHIIDVQVSFLEIYNEEIRDLLVESGSVTPRGGLQIREDSNKSIKVAGLTELQPNNADEVKQIVMQGNVRRTQSPTHANETSSRSHAVLQVHVAQSPRTAALSEERTVATLSIIDLAGSERAAATMNMGKRMVEGANINKSLLALGNCINALCESGGAIRHVPYRNSKLTRLLKFSLGGNCKTVMIVCVAPTSAHFDDTHNTLIYAERATKIKTKVVTRNVVNVDRHVGQYVEAINRLNIEVEELKAKLAGKRDAEADKEKRKRREAAVEVEKAKADMQVKTDQTQPSLVDGATCSGKLSVAEAKSKVIRARLAELDVQAASGTLSADLQAERGLLRALAAPEDQVLKTGSDLNARVQRSNNSSSMFEAMLRAVSERKSDKLDETSIDNVKLDARWRKAEMERVKAEARKDALMGAVETQAHTTVSMVGLVGRCNVMLGEASRALQAAADKGTDELLATVNSLTVSLQKVADGNDKVFKSIVGYSTAEYLVGPPSTSALDSFKGYAAPSAPPMGMGRVVSGPARASDVGTKISRRMSSYDFDGVTSTLRKSHRSPRKSLRSHMAGAAPYRRASDNITKGKKKGVQWRDEVGQGDIDDGGMGATSTPAISIIAPESPLVSEPSVLGEPTISASSSGEASGSSSDRNTPSRTGSDSDWEDERTDDSFNMSFVAGPSRAPTVTLTGNGVGHTRRTRASHLTSGFLKSRTRLSPLGSLPETDEERNTPKKVSPLGDRNMNRAPSPSGSSSSSSTATVRDRAHASPAKRALLTPKVLGANKGGRRRSNVGPLRVERPRRRSSMIPQLSPKMKGKESAASGDMSVLGMDKGSVGPARRVAAERSSPKRPKRSSSTMLSASVLSRPPSRLTAKPSDSNISMTADISFRGSGRPTWR